MAQIDTYYIGISPKFDTAAFNRIKKQIESLGKIASNINIGLKANTKVLSGLKTQVKNKIKAQDFAVEIPIKLHLTRAALRNFQREAKTLLSSIPPIQIPANIVTGNTVSGGSKGGISTGNRVIGGGGTINSRHSIGSAIANTATYNVAYRIVNALMSIPGAALEASMSFEKSMTEVRAVLKQSTGITEDEYKKLTDLATKTGEETKLTMSESADAMYMLAINGISAADMLNGVYKATVTTALALDAPLSDTADLMTDIRVQFGLTADDFDKISNRIAAVAVNSKMQFQDIAYAFANAGSVAGQVGLSVDDFTTTIAYLAPIARTGRDMSTSLKQFLLYLNPRSKEAASIKKDFGLDFFDNGKLKPIREVFNELIKGFGQLSTEKQIDLSKTMFGTDSVKVALSVLQQGIEKFDELDARMKKTNAAQLAADRTDNLSGSVTKFSSAVEVLWNTIINQDVRDYLASTVDESTLMIKRITAAVKRSYELLAKFYQLSNIANSFPSFQGFEGLRHGKLPAGLIGDTAKWMWGIKDKTSLDNRTSFATPDFSKAGITFGTLSNKVAENMHININAPTRDGKDIADAFVKGLPKATPNNLDSLSGSGSSYLAP